MEKTECVNCTARQPEVDELKADLEAAASRALIFSCKYSEKVDEILNLKATQDKLVEALGLAISLAESQDWTADDDSWKDFHKAKDALTQATKGEK